MPRNRGWIAVVQVRQGDGRCTRFVQGAEMVAGKRETARHITTPHVFV